MLAENNMAGLFASQAVSRSRHVFIHILIAYGCLFIGNPFSVKGFVQSEIRHNGRNNRIVKQASLLFHVFSANIHNAVAVYYISLIVHSNTAVRITVIGKTGIAALLCYKFLKVFNMGRAAVCVDVQAIGLIVYHKGLSAQSVKYILCNGRSASVGTVQCHLPVFKGTCCNRDQISDIAVSSGCKIHSTSNHIPLCKRKLLHLPVQIALNLRNHCFFQLLSLFIDDLNAVVIIRIVTGRNHDAAVKALCAHHIGNAWSRCYMKEKYVCSGSCKTGYQRVFKHIAASAGIFSDDNPAALSRIFLSVVPA